MLLETTTHVDSDSVGDPSRFRSVEALRAGRAILPPPPRRLGAVALIVRRVAGGRREVLEHTLLDPQTGVPGDAWERRLPRDPAAQLTVMQIDVARLIANDQPVTLFGDNLFFDLDLATRNLPIGSRVVAGGATLEVSPLPHNGCKKFAARFGNDALRFVAAPADRHLNLRGIYLRVVAAGEIAVGDPVVVDG